MADYDAKGLQDKDNNKLNFTPTHFMDAQGNSKSIDVEFGNKQDLQKTVNLEQSLSDIRRDFIVSIAYLYILHRLGNNGNNVFVTYKVGELSEEDDYEIKIAYIDVPYSLNDSKKASIHVLLDLTDATRTYPIAANTNFLTVIVRDSDGNNLFHEGGNASAVDCLFGQKYIFHITGNTFTSRPLNRKYYSKAMVEGFVNTNAWSLIGASTVDYKLCNWGEDISAFMPRSSNYTRSQYGYLFTIIYTLSIIVENNSSADINVAFNIGRESFDTNQARPVLVGCGQYAIVPANSRKYIDLSATDSFARSEVENTYGKLNLYMTIDGSSWTSTDRVYVGKGHARLIVDFTDPIQN